VEVVLRNGDSSELAVTAVGPVAIISYGTVKLEVAEGMELLDNLQIQQTLPNKWCPRRGNDEQVVVAGGAIFIENAAAIPEHST
jgi:hypothetical protein